MSQAIKEMSADTSALLGKYMRYPFAEGNYSLALGLVPMAEETWLDIDEHYAAEMREKARRLRDEYPAVFCALPGSQQGQADVLEMLLEHLAIYYPNSFRISRASTSRNADDGLGPDTRIENLINDETWRVGDFNAAPLDLAGRLIQEDLCLMSPDGRGTYMLSAGSVCFPLRWELTEKFGRTMEGIHHAVPGYDEKLSSPSDRYMLGLKAYKPSWRANWSVVDASDLYLKQRRFKQGQDSDITADNAGRRLWIRSERQTLRRLPRSGDILFSIRTYIRPLSVLEGLPSVARGLAQALDKLPAEMRGYKNLLPIRKALLAYLSRVSG
ncbi:MAG: heme-dependent oxidative N-demethylase family protein [Candidatus Binataceae bacterium]